MTHSRHPGVRVLLIKCCVTHRVSAPKALGLAKGKIRRGWYWGGEEFKERLWGRVAAVTAGKKRESYASEAVRAHDERMAEQWLKGGLAALGLSLSEARTLRHNDRRKQGLAWLLRSSTVLSADGVIEWLSLGHRSNVSRAMRAFKESPKDAVAIIRRILPRCKYNMMQQCKDHHFVPIPGLVLPTLAWRYGRFDARVPEDE